MVPLTDYENLISTLNAMGFEEWYGPDEDTPERAFVARTFAEGWKEVTISSMGGAFDDDVHKHIFRFTFAGSGQLRGYYPVPLGD